MFSAGHDDLVLLKGYCHQRGNRKCQFLDNNMRHELLSSNGKRGEAGWVPTLI